MSKALAYNRTNPLEPAIQPYIYNIYGTGIKIESEAISIRPAVHDAMLAESLQNNFWWPSLHFLRPPITGNLLPRGSSRSAGLEVPVRHVGYILHSIHFDNFLPDIWIE